MKNCCNAVDGTFYDAINCNIMISVENLSKSYGDWVLFENIGFKINPREKVGLVGRNGHGKTTLFDLISGAQSPDSGAIGIPKNYRLGYVSQKLEFETGTVLEEGMRGLGPDSEGESWQVEKILAGLGFSKDDLHRSPLDFSGGYQVRLNLAKTLVSRPDCLMLDEPTNYLDITSIRWIKRFLNAWPGELLLITHDRGFMDDVVTHVLGIVRKNTRKIMGDTQKFYSRIAQDEEIHEKTRKNQERRKKEIEKFVSRFRAKARLANLVQSRMKTLQKMTPREKLQHYKTLEFRFNEAPFTGKYMQHAENLTFSYEKNCEAPLISDFSINIASGARVCIVGRNGAGKTTLLKMLAGDLQPDTGRIVYHPNLVTGFFEQTNIASLVDDRTVEEEILFANPSMSRQAARNICGAMLFEGDAALKKIGVLSGGEKCRVMLGKLLGAPANFLLLDEPTNHFDMESSDALLAAIDTFAGGVVMVTHNEMFLHALAERLIVFSENGIEVFDGTYQAFLDAGGWGDDDALDRPGTRPAAVDADADESGQLAMKDYKRLRSEVITEKNRATKPLKSEIERLERLIMDQEARLQELNETMQGASNNGDSRDIGDLSRRIGECQASIDKAFEQMEAASETHDALEGQFDARLARLEEQRPF